MAICQTPDQLGRQYTKKFSIKRPLHLSVAIYHTPYLLGTVALTMDKESATLPNGSSLSRKVVAVAAGEAHTLALTGTRLWHKQRRIDEF